MEFDRAELAKYLSIGELFVTFTKKDGSERVMRCTIDTHLIPTDKQPTSNTQSDKTSDQFRVFDTELQEWRSFLISNVKHIELV